MLNLVITLMNPVKEWKNQKPQPGGGEEGWWEEKRAGRRTFFSRLDL